MVHLCTYEQRRRPGVLLYTRTCVCSLPRSLSGTVVDLVTAPPLNKVRVLAEPVAREGRLAWTTTDAKGNFTLLDLVPGQYRVKGRRNGYLDAYYGARRPEGKGTPITLEAGQEISRIARKDYRGALAALAQGQRDAPNEPITVQDGHDEEAELG